MAAIRARQRTRERKQDEPTISEVEIFLTISNPYSWRIFYKSKGTSWGTRSEYAHHIGQGTLSLQKYYLFGLRSSLSTMLQMREKSEIQRHAQDIYLRIKKPRSSKVYDFHP